MLLELYHGHEMDAQQPSQVVSGNSLNDWLDSTRDRLPGPVQRAVEMCKGLDAQKDDVVSSLLDGIVKDLETVRQAFL